MTATPAAPPARAAATRSAVTPPIASTGIAGPRAPPRGGGPRPGRPALDGVAHTGPKSAKSAPTGASPGGCVETPIRGAPPAAGGARRRPAPRPMRAAPLCRRRRRAQRPSRSFTKSSGARARRSPPAGVRRAPAAPPGQVLVAELQGGSPASTPLDDRRAGPVGYQDEPRGRRRHCSPTQEPSSATPSTRLHAISFTSGGQQRLFHHARGGTMPWKNIQDTASRPR